MYNMGVKINLYLFFYVVIILKYMKVITVESNNF